MMGNTTSVCVTHPGRKKINQDAVLYLKAEREAGKRPAVLAAVCDGMGGHAMGETASRIAAQMIEQWFMTALPALLLPERKSEVVAKSRTANGAGSETEGGAERDGAYRKSEIAESLQALLRRINTVLLRGGTTPDARFQCGAAAPPRPEMGTTAAILLLLDDVYIAVHIGDSRIYAFSEREPLITCDHSWVMEEVKAGRLRKEEMKNDPRRNILMRCLGITQDAEADVTVGRRKENAVYLVCSDGFWRENETDEFEKLLAGRSPENRRSAQAALARILDRNMSRGEDDNMSAVWIREERLKGKRSKQDGIKQRFWSADRTGGRQTV